MPKNALSSEDTGSDLVFGERNPPPSPTAPARLPAKIRADHPRGKRSKGNSAAGVTNNRLVTGVVLRIAAVATIGSVAVYLVRNMQPDNPTDLSGWHGTEENVRNDNLLPDVAEPKFPELGTPVRTFPSGVTTYFVDMSRIPTNGSGPGERMTMRVYLPAGEYADGTIPCVLVAPAGTNLLVGNELDADDYHEETLPYANAGMACVFYSLDGACDVETAPGREYHNAYVAYKAAGAGTLNGQKALEFVLARIPQVNRKRIVCAGHSSAATVSLLLSARDARLAACIAYCPVLDLETRMGELANDPGVRQLLPGIGEYLRETSPNTHAANIRCPVFLFGVRDDGNTPYSSTVKFQELLQQHGADVTLESVNAGGHYQPMVDEGISAAIRWLEEKLETAD